MAVQSEKSVSQVAQDLGVHETTLYGWIAKFYPDRNKKSAKESESLEVELKRLRRENARLKQERDILKKASAYFASEML
jgi:transposase